MTVTVLIASYLEPELVARIEGSAPDVRVLYDSELLPEPQYRGDHSGRPRLLTAEQQRRWDAMLAEADVAFDFDWQDPAELPRRAPRLRWVQATSAGIGAFLRRTGLHDSALAISTGGGIHAVPLAEFALAGTLFFVKDFRRLQRDQADHNWRRHTTDQLAGRRVTVVGLGGMGSHVARTFAAVGCRVTGVGRAGGRYDLPEAVTVTDIAGLDEVLEQSDVLVLCTALTPETTGLISERRLALLPDGAILVNIARGPVVDETAMTHALRDRRLAGACLDVFETEPLPVDSALWDLDNVLISPHSASTMVSENSALTDLFLANLARFRAGDDLINEYSRSRGY